MLTPDLRIYLESLRALPVIPSDQKVREVLLGAGWNDESINDAIRFFDEIKTHSVVDSVNTDSIISNSFSKKQKDNTNLNKPGPSVDVSDIDFAEGEDQVLDKTQQDSESEIKQSVSSSVPVQSIADAGHSSQSVLYPDNSSRLGMRGMNEEPVSSLGEKKLESEIIKKEGPPLMDLDALVSQIPKDEVSEKKVDDSLNGIESARQSVSNNSSRVSTPSVVKTDNSVQGLRVQPVNNFANQVKCASFVDGVRPFVHQQSQNPTRPVTIMLNKKMAPTSGMPDVRPPQLIQPLSPIQTPQPKYSNVLEKKIERVDSGQVIAKSRSSRRFVTRVGFIAVLFGVVAAVVYAYSMNLGPFASVGPYQESQFVSDFSRGIASINTAVVTGSYDLSFVDRDEKTKTLPVLGSGATTTLAYFFPGLSLPVFKESDAHFGVSVSGNYQKDSNQELGTNFSINVESLYGGAGENIDGKIKILHVGTTTYFQVEKTPNLALLKDIFGDVSKIEGKWVDTTSVNSEETLVEKWVKKVSELAGRIGKPLVISALASALDQEQVISFAKSPESIESWKGPAVRYTIVFDFKRLAVVMRRMANDSLTSGGVYTFFADDFSKLAASLERPEAEPLLSYLSQNTLMTVDVGEDGAPLALAFTSRMAPSNENGDFSNKELNSNFVVTLTDVNQGKTITLPDETISIQEASQKMINLTTEEYKLSLQLQRVGIMTQAIDTFSKVVGRLPTSLDELLSKGGDFNIKSESLEGNNKILGEQYISRPFLVSVSVDAYTGEPFFYGLGITGDDYNLAYRVTLPPIREEALVYISPWAYQFLTSETTPKGNGYAWRIINGENTATKKMFSVEGKVYR